VEERRDARGLGAPHALPDERAPAEPTPRSGNEDPAGTPVGRDPASEVPGPESSDTALRARQLRWLKERTDYGNRTGAGARSPASEEPRA
jgi:hypothetical protein